MLDAIVVGNHVDEEEYDEAVPALREELVELQHELRARDFSVLVHLVGTDTLGCEALYDRLHEWLDARYLLAEAFDLPSEEELERPRFWRYWRALPPRGRIGVHHGAWTLGIVTARLRGELDEHAFDACIEHVRRFETMLVDDGLLLLKVWPHVTKEELERRLESAAADPVREGFVDDADWRLLQRFDEVLPLAEEYVRRTDGTRTPWLLIEGTDSRYRDLAVGRALRDALRARLDSEPACPAPRFAEVEGSASVLDRVDTEAELDKREYAERLTELQGRLADLSGRASIAGIPTVLVLEGWDAAGKGGAIRRLTAAMRARLCRVVPIGAPTEEERAHHYLWRFWKHLPRAGRMTIFDRSWYGRVLVERVEGYATESEWRRAYSEINEFEAQLVESGCVVRKFFLHLTAEEQLRRFESREETGHKRYKLTDEDWRNREKRDIYVEAVDEMVRRTSTDVARWHLVSSEDKRWARVRVLEVVTRALEGALAAR